MVPPGHVGIARLVRRRVTPNEVKDLALGPVIDAAQVAALHAYGTSPVILDASFDLADPRAGERSFAETHVAGSLYVHLDRDLCGPKTGRNGRHPLPERAAFARTVGALGIGPDSRVVVLDAQGGPYAARLWWMLKWLGHEHVAVLDGGLAAWREFGGGFETAVSTPLARAPYPDRPSLVGAVDAGAVSRRPDGAVVLDARSPERFRGESEPIDPVAGRIPGAINRFHRANLDADGRFKPAEALRAEFEAQLAGRPPSAVIHSCGSGVTACHNLLAMERAGLAGSLLYPGSWSEWSADPTRPVARG